MGAFDGSGNFVRSYNWTSDASNGIDITASRFDTEDNGFASGLSLCLTRDGQGVPSGALNWPLCALTTLSITPGAINGNVSFGAIYSASSQPAFVAERLTTSLSITGSAISDLIFNGTDYGQGTGYSGSTGVFTAPAGGLHFFMCSLALQGAGGIVNAIYFSKNNNTNIASAGNRYDIGVGLTGATYSSGTTWLSGCCLIVLAQNDTVRMKWDAGSGGPNTLGISSKFMGFKVA